jgi:hypothetical protein
MKILNGLEMSLLSGAGIALFVSKIPNLIIQVILVITGMIFGFMIDFYSQRRKDER